MNDKINLDEIRLASPCHARWEDMNGDDHTRFCGQCNKHVYNFSAMTRVEVGNLIREKEGRLCGRFYRRTDGRLLTTDCPSEARQRRNWLKRIGAAVMAFFLSFTGGCMMGSVETPKTTRIENLKQKPEPFIGAVAYIPPPTNHLAPFDSSKK